MSLSFVVLSTTFLRGGSNGEEVSFKETCLLLLSHPFVPVIAILQHLMTKLGKGYKEETF